MWLDAAAEKKLKLADRDDTARMSLTECQGLGSSKKSAAVMFHNSDGHCHLLSGTVSPADFAAALSAKADYASCAFVKSAGF